LFAISIKCIGSQFFSRIIFALSLIDLGLTKPHSISQKLHSSSEILFSNDKQDEINFDVGFLLWNKFNEIIPDVISSLEIKFHFSFKILYHAALILSISSFLTSLNFQNFLSSDHL